jgi:hypothetical protein
MNTRLEKPVSIKPKVKNGRLILDLSGIEDDGIDTVLVMKLDRSAMDLDPIDVGGKDLEVPFAAVKASSSFSDEYAPEGIISGGKGAFEAGIHRKKDWVARGDQKPQWFEADFEKPEVISAIKLGEPRGRLLIRKYTVEYNDNGTWKTLFSGDRIGPDFAMIFDPVKTDKVRLNILEYAPNDPGLSTFKVYRNQ